MRKEELKRKLKELEEREFIINMVDRWTNEDRELLRRIREEKNTIKKELATAQIKRKEIEKSISFLLPVHC